MRPTTDMTKSLVIATALTLSTLSVTATAATEIAEPDPSSTAKFERSVVDAVFAKPLQLTTAIAGTSAYFVSLPFNLISGDVKTPAQTLVIEPFEALQRCLGCTPAEEQQRQRNLAAGLAPNQVRLTIDQPSEIIITTEDKVIIKQ